MKQGTQFALPVEIGMSLDEVSRIEFVFKQKSCKGFPAIKSNVWPDDCTRQEGQNIILIPWTRAETYKFMGGETLYMDTRITLRDSTDQPEPDLIPGGGWLMIQVRVAQQSAVSVRIAGAAPVRVDVTGTAVVSAPEYSGPYDITPLFTAQVLPTAKKLMQKDVTIRKIPQYEVSNDSNGYTLIIGEEYYNAQ